MRLPLFNELAQSKEMLEEFGGYNHNLRINNGEWYDQKNMCTDYYPMASTRNQRAISILNGEDITFTYGSDTYTIISKALDGCVVTDGNILTLHKVKKNGNNYGLWFLRDGQTVGENYPAQIVEKAAYFNKNAPKHNIVKMASYICVLPDGVVYESANTTDNVPVFSVEHEESASNLVFKTAKVNLDSNLGYTPIALDGTNYRYKEKQIQYYIEEDKLWVNQPTVVLIYKANTTGTFGKLKEGDVVNFTYDSFIGDQYTTTNYKAGIFDSSAKIINKGVIKNGQITGVTSDTDFIVVDGYMLVYYSRGGGAPSALGLSATANNATLERKMPVVSNIGFAAQNRLWCCDKDGHEYYASALDNPYNFYDFSHLSTDSFAQNVLTDGRWTGGASYNDTPIFFKENAAHIVQGYYPINDGVQDGNSYADRAMTDFRGCESGSNKSFATIDNILYYKSKQGIVAFDGANTTLVSVAFGNVHYKNVIAIRKGDKYYAAMKDDSGQSHIFAYDTKKGTWSKEDNLNVDFAVNYLGAAGFVGKGADIPAIPIQVEQFAYLLDVTAERAAEVEGHLESDLGLDIDWMCETGTYGYSYPNNKYISRFQIRLQIAAGATASVFIQYDSDGVWHKKGEFSNKGTKTYLLPIVPQRCDHMKLKFEGKGDVKIISIAKILEEGGDV